MSKRHSWVQECVGFLSINTLWSSAGLPIRPIRPVPRIPRTHRGPPCQHAWAALFHTGRTCRRERELLMEPLSAAPCASLGRGGPSQTMATKIYVLRRILIWRWWGASDVCCILYLHSCIQANFLQKSCCAYILQLQKLNRMKEFLKSDLSWAFYKLSPLKFIPVS